jgi:hypothetical protein
VLVDHRAARIGRALEHDVAVVAAPPSIAASRPPSRNASSRFDIAPALSSSVSSSRSVNSWLPFSSTKRMLPVATIAPVVRFQLTASARTDWSAERSTTSPSAVTVSPSLS